MTPGDEDEATLLRGGRLAYGCYELTYTGRSGGTALEMDAATLNLRISLLQVRSRLELPRALSCRVQPRSTCLPNAAPHRCS